MATSTVFHPRATAARLGYVRVRDHILVDAALQAKLGAMTGSVTLVAREIEHAPGIDLTLPGCRVVIVADRYDAKGRTVNVSGADAAPNRDGDTGSVGLATANFNRPGGRGTDGRAGQPAGHAGSIRIIVQRLGEVRLLARGGAGGQAGTGGTPGTIRLEPIGASSFWTHTTRQLGADATSAWAAHRLLVGVFFYRQFKPGVAGFDDRLRWASTEFEAVLRLHPGHADAARRNQQIELGQNVLGFPANFDLDPRFDEYLQRFASFATFIATFYHQGIDLLLAGDARSVAEMQHALEAGRIATEVAFSMSDLGAAESGVKAASAAADDLEARLSVTNGRIRAASAAKPGEGISLGTVFATVGTVAAAVGSVIDAVPTAGASLYALVPSLAGLAVQLNTIGGHLFEATTAEKDALKSKYEKVGKNVDNVVKGVKAVVNLVDAIKLLTDGKTAGNSEVVDLMRQGVQLAHELLVAKLRVDQAVLTATARTLQVEGGQSLQRLAAAQREQLARGERIFTAAGRSAIRATQRKIDSTLRVSFQAQRSVEIYTLKDASGLIAFDTGFIHPDVEADFDEQELDVAALAGAYSRSFQSLVDPLDLQLAFDSYFSSDLQFELVRGLKFASASDAASLDALRTSHNGGRRIVFLIDFPDLPADVEAKIERVSVALVGASALRPALGCVVQHGGVYLSRRRSGEDVTQALSEHIAQVSPQFQRFIDRMPSPSTGAQGSARARTDHLWGRALGGPWMLTLWDQDLVANGVDLSGVTAVELLFETQVFALKRAAA